MERKLLGAPILGLLLVSTFAAFLLAAPVIPHAYATSPVTVSTSTSSVPVISAPGHNVFFANTLWWEVFDDGAHIRYCSSGDGTTWVNCANIRAIESGEDANYLGVESNPTTHGFCYAYDVDFNTGSDTKWRCGTLGSNGVITFYSTEHTLTKTTFGAEGGLPNTSIQNDTNNNIWIVAATNGGHNEYWEITSNGATSTKQKDCGHSQCGATVAGPGTVLTLKLAGGDMASVYADSTSSNGHVCVMGFSGSTFNTAVCSVRINYATQNNAYSATTSGTNKVLVTMENTTGNHQGYWMGCTYPCTSLSTSDTLFLSETAGGWMSVASNNASKFEATYLSHAAPTTTILYNITTNSGSTWDTGHTLTSGETSISLEIGGGATYLTTTGCIGISWRAAAGSPFNVRFAIQDTCVSTVTETITITMDNSAATQTVSITGCNPSQSTVSADGSGHAITTDPACSITFTPPSNSSTIHYVFSGHHGKWIFTTPGSGSESRNNTLYQELQNTYQATPKAQTTWDSGLTAQAVVGTQGGTGSFTGCSITLTGGGGAANCSAFFDYNRAAVIGSSTISGAPANSQWLRNGACSFSDTTASNTHNCDFYKQWTNNFKYSVTYGGSPAAPTLSCNSLGSAATLSLTTSNQAFYCDNAATASATNPTSDSTSTERWTNLGKTFSITAGGATDIFAYYHQYLVAFGVSPSSSGTTSPSATAFYNATTLPVVASANGGFDFILWVPTAGITLASPASASTNATIGATGTLTAVFIATSTTSGAIIGGDEIGLVILVLFILGVGVLYLGRRRNEGVDTMPS